MGKLKDGILGGFSGTVGTVVGSSLNGKDLMRSKPKKRKKSSLIITPQNLKLPLISGFMANIKGMIDLGYHDKGHKISSFNQAVKYNMQHAITGKAPNFEINYSKVVISRGKLEPAWSGHLKIVKTGLMKVSWEIPDSVKLKLIATDKTYVLIYNSTKKIFIKSEEQAERAELSQLIKLSDFEDGDLLHAYLFFVSADRKTVSNSEYMGFVQI